MNNNKQEPKSKEKILYIIIGILAVIIAIFAGGKLSQINFFGLTVVLPTQAAANPFTGTWQGIDAYDTSTITMALTQNGNQLQGTLSDTFTKRPDGTVLSGASGAGTGKVLSPTEAEMTFDLTRPTGESLQYYIKLKLSDSNTLIFEDSTILVRQ